MKIVTTILFVALIFITCTKENNSKMQAANKSNSTAANDTVKIPLNDLGTGTFNGYIGGLYPNGLNYATGTYASELLKTCNSIVPIDTFGQPSDNGKILFISLGWSTGGQNMRELQMKTVGNPLTNPKLSLLSFSYGGGTARLNNIMNPNDPYWNYVAQRVKGSGTSYRQVQIIYLETEDSTKNVSFPGRPLQVKRELEASFHVFKQKFPNVKLIYLLARTSTFGTHQHVWNLDPCPYYFGWACKWAIEDNIKAIENSPEDVNKTSPMIAWGFYQWATGTPRITDGFKWTADLTNDGLHANDVGKDTLATRFQNFLLADKYAKTWYAK